MHRFFRTSFSFCLALLLALANSAQAQQGRGEAENAAFVRGLYDAFARGDVPAVVAGMHENIEWTEAAGFPYAGTYIGPDAVLENVFAKLGTEWEGYQAVPREYIPEGDKVVALGTYSGTFKDTGRSFRAPFAHVWTIKDGKATRFQQITDTELVQRTLSTHRLRAAPSERVMVLTNRVKPDKREQFEGFVRGFLLPGVEQLAQTDERAAQALAQTRFIVPTEPNEDGTWTYLFVMDPVVPGFSYGFETLKKVYPAAEVDRQVQIFSDTLADQQTAIVGTQSNI